MLTAATLFVHLVSFAIFLGAGFTQGQMIKLSARPATSAELRDTYERLAATIATKIEVPAVFGSILSGIVFVAQSPALMKQGWLHGKLLCVLALAVLSHLEMFNARRIAELRAEGGATVEGEIANRKKRHATFGGLAALLFVALLFLVTFVRLRAFSG